MRIKPALCMALLSLSLIAACCGACFAQSDSPISPANESLQTTHATMDELVAVAVVPKFTPVADAPADDPTGNSAENVSREASQPGTKESGQTPFTKIGIGVKISTLGAGIEVATPLAEKVNLRGGFNMLRYSRGLTNDGIHYDGNLQFQSVEAHLDWFLFSGFHISPGVLLYNGNQLTATAAVPGGQTFSVGGTSYESDPAVPVTGTGKLDFVKVSPSIMVGFGNLIPRNGRRFSFLVEVGGAYQGSARVALNLAGNVCDTTGMNCEAISSDPTVQANIHSQQVKIHNDVNPYRFYPILSLGVGFNF